VDLITTKWLDYGPIGVLVLFGIGVYFAWKEVNTRMSADAAFTQTLATNAIAMMKEAHDKALDVQVKTAEAIVSVTAELRRIRECEVAEHDEIKAILGKLLQPQGIDTGGE